MPRSNCLIFFLSIILLLSPISLLCPFRIFELQNFKLILSSHCSRRYNIGIQKCLPEFLRETLFYIMIWVSKHPNLDYTDCSMLCVLLLTGYAAIMYIISATADFCPAGKIKHYFSMTDIPPSILILGNSVIICIDFSAFHTPPECTVKIHTGTVEINLSTDDSPVSVFIGCKTVVVKINFSSGKSPPAIFIGRQTL